jgi:hypothetical protein
VTPKQYPATRFDAASNPEERRSRKRPQAQSNLSTRLRCSASVIEILGEAAMDARNFNQQDIAEFNLRGEHSRCCIHASQEVTLVVRLFDRT